MKKPKPDGSTYIDAVHGYVMEKHEGKWYRQHRLVMERHLGRKLEVTELVHHKDHDKTNNIISNLEIISREAHASEHHAGVTRSKETVKKLSEAAKRRCSDPVHRKHLSERAKRQHKEGRFGRKPQ